MKNALCLGTFDGVHIGHREVLLMAKGYNSSVITFKTPPKAVLKGENELLMTLEDRKTAFKEAGISQVCVLDFNEVRDQSPLEFLENLLKRFEPSRICCGFNYRFGKNGKGDTELLKRFCHEKGIEFCLCEPVSLGGELVSSSRIRRLLKEAKFQEAEALLGRPFSFEADVIGGDKRGRTIGFPTANQEYPKELIALKRGVYKTKVIIDSTEFDSITNIGLRPTFETEKIMCETYIKNFKGDIYGKKMRLIPLSFLREEKKFSSLEELKKQIEKDISGI